MSRSVHSECLDQHFELSGSPKRIVSPVSSATEALYHMGFLDRLVDVSAYCH